MDTHKQTTFVTFVLTLTLLLNRPFEVQGQTKVGRTLVEGDIYVHVIAAVYTDTNATTGSCQSIESETVQLIEAIKWIYQQLNHTNYITGVSIGLRVSETCASMEKAKAVALDLSAELAGEDPNMRTVGVIGHDYSSESEAISSLFSALPDQYRLLQMSYSATALSLRDREKYPNFFRLIPSDDLQVQTLKSFVEAMNFTYMALVYSNNSYGEGLRDLLHDAIDEINFCVPVEIPLANDINNISEIEAILQAGLIDASPPISGVLVFVQYVTTERLLSAFRNIISNTTGNTSRSPPVFVFSEASAYASDSFTDIIQGSFVLSPRKKVIDQFAWTDRVVDLQRLYMEAESNTWLRDMYLAGTGCELADSYAGNTCGTKQLSEINAIFPDSPYTQYAVQTALTMAKVIKDVYDQTCSSPGLCSEFLTLPRSRFIDVANTINVHYDDDFGAFEVDAFKTPDLETAFNNSAEVILKTNLPLYEVYNFQNVSVSKQEQVKVAEFSNVREFTLQKDTIVDYFNPDFRGAQCPDGFVCPACTASTAAGSVLYIPGDLFIVGIVPIHEKGPTPLMCGENKPGGIDVAEAVRFAVKEETLDASVGVIIIDSCNDPQIIQENLLTLHRLGIYRNGAYIPVADKIIGYVGGWTSDVSKAVAEITTRLGIPQVSYASTATSLSRRALYTYFSRIPTPDNEQARYMVDLARDVVKTNYAQIVYSEGEYGEGGREILVQRAADSKICVAQEIKISGESEISTLLQTLREHKDAKVLLMFISSNDAKIIQVALNGMVPGEFVIIASEGWGRRFDVAQLDKLAGSISLTSELDTNDRFTDDMSKLSIETANQNFWVRPYIEQTFNCYSQWSFNKTSGVPCSNTLSLEPSVYRIDVWAPFTERAVLALLGGAKAAMNKYCGNTNALCDNLRNNTPGFYDEIKSQKFLDNGISNRLFDDNGDGQAGYRIYVISNQPDEQYFQIGQINPGSVIFFETNKFVQRGGRILNYTCSGQKRCLECFPVTVTIDEKTELNTGLIVVLVILGVVCCILGAILLYICNKQGCCIKIENGRLKMAEYITPVHEENTRAPGDGGDYNYISDGQVNTQAPRPLPRDPSFGRSLSHSLQNEYPSNETNASGSGGSKTSRSGYSGSTSGSGYAPSNPPQHVVTYARSSDADSGVNVSQVNIQEQAPQAIKQHQLGSHDSGYLNPQVGDGP